MKNQPSARAYLADKFWTEVVAVLSPGKELRPEHYLVRLSAEDLQKLRAALACSGSYAERRLLCPPRTGGATDGELPPVSLLCEINQAIRQANVLREMQTQALAEAAAKGRCKELGLDPALTNAVVRIVGEEALDQKAKEQVGDFAISAAQVLLMAEGMRTKGKQEDLKIELKKQAESRATEQLKLEREKFQIAACEFFLAWFKDKKAQEIANSTASNAEKISQLRLEYFKDVDALQKSGKVVLPE